MKLNVAAFEEFCGALVIPSRDAGPVPFVLRGTQRRWMREVAAGLEAGVHDFTTLKGGRQIGGTTIADAMALWWPQGNDGIQGMLVSDDDDNRDYRRDVLLGMLDSLPKAYRQPVRLNNRGMLAWANGSRLGFGAAGLKSGGNLGRSRGLNFLHADEVGSWPDLKAASSLRAAWSKRHAHRLALWNSTARGIGTPFHDMWQTAIESPTQWAIFLAWWMDETNQLEVPTKTSPVLVKTIWARYAAKGLDADERLLVAEVKRRYKTALSPAQIGWRRWQLESEMHGDEVMLAQEFGSLPEECFQAFGTKFLRPARIRELRATVDRAAASAGYRYEFGDTLDATTLVPVAPAEAPLRVWDEPQPDGAYVIAGHPQFSSSPEAPEFVAQVWRVWPDQMVQVAEYAAEDGAMYQFAWTLLHLCGAYRTFIPPYFICEVAGTGYRVLQEITLIQRHGYGLSQHQSRLALQNFLGSIARYFYYRPDSIRGRGETIEWKTGVNNRAWALHTLRDVIERGHMAIKSGVLVDQLSALRQGEQGDNDEIAGGARTSDARVMCAALAAQAWLDGALPDLESLIARKETGPSEPETVIERQVQGWMQRVLTKGR